MNLAAMAIRVSGISDETMVRAIQNYDTIEEAIDGFISGLNESAELLEQDSNPEVTAMLKEQIEVIVSAMDSVRSKIRILDEQVSKAVAGGG